MSAVSLLIVASNRLAFALVGAAAFLWVSLITMLAVSFFEKWLPRRGKMVVVVFLSGLASELFLIALKIFNPILALQCTFFILLTPCWAIGSKALRSKKSHSDYLFESLVICVLLIAFAFIREPIGFSTLSIPGGVEGITEIMRSTTQSFFPIRFAASTGGALILFGYGYALFRSIRKPYINKKNW
jgi:hypothetical protein